MNHPLWESHLPLSANQLTAPSLHVPAGACDAHMHVFGPADRYPAVPGARYTCPPATAAQYEAVARALHLERAVLVQPSYYGSDNACLLDALAADPSRRRGVVMLPPVAPIAQWRDWHERGVRGIRIDLFKAVADQLNLAQIQALLRRTCERAASLAWSVDLYVPGRCCMALLEVLPRLPCPVSIAHMGYLAAADGISDAWCDEFIDVVRTAPVWPKLSGLYRYGDGAGQARAHRLARGLLAASPDRLLWGSDWPHVMAAPQDGGAILNELGLLCPDERLQHRILATNPARLYGFAAA